MLVVPPHSETSTVEHSHHPRKLPGPPSETKQDPAGPSRVQKPLCVPHFLFVEKGSSLPSPS